MSVFDIDKQLNEYLSLINTADNSGTLQEIKVKITGKNGVLKEISSKLKDVPSEEKPAAGRVINEFKEKIMAALSLKFKELDEKTYTQTLKKEIIDVSLPTVFNEVPNEHILIRAMNEIISVFQRMGFSIETGPEAELDFYNFEALNIGKNHPARDMHDTFYFTDEIVLRTHTSPVQVRTMLKKKPPLKVIAPGKVYRCDSDITHSPMFHQVEGLWVDETINFGGLKAVLTAFINEIFDKARTRFRPSYFPFTEPSAEMDISCIFCGGEGCGICKQTGWLEILGCGMVNNKVFEYSNVDFAKYRGFAFGIGVERVAMLKYGIKDIRLFYENDIRFLKNF